MAPILALTIDGMSVAENSTVNFPSGITSPLTVTLQNTGDMTLNVQEIGLPNNLVFPTGEMPIISIPAGGAFALQLNVTGVPVTGNIDLLYLDPNPQGFSVTLSATSIFVPPTPDPVAPPEAIAPPPDANVQPDIAIALTDGTAIPDGTPTAVTFPPTSVGGITTLSFSISNSGTAPLEISNISVPAGFSLNPILTATLATGPLSIPANQNVTVPVSTNTTVAETFTGNLIVQSNDPDTQFYNFPLSATLTGGFRVPPTPGSLAAAQSALLDAAGNAPDPLSDIVGNGQANQLVGTDADERITGLGMDDTIQGGAGRDLIAGNQGDDDIEGGDGNDSIFGGQNNDRIQGGNNDDVLFGDLGNDSVNGNAGSDLVFGNGGDDTLFGGQGTDVLVGGLDNDFLAGDLGNDTLQGGLGMDTFAIALDSATDTILDFTEGSDRIGLGGGLSFEDLTIAPIPADSPAAIAISVNTDSGPVILATVQGPDPISLGASDFVDLRAVLVSTLENLFIDPDPVAPANALEGTDGPDLLAQQNLVFGRGDSDFLSGTQGDDSLFGGAGPDVLQSLSSNDFLSGGLGSDTLFGGANDDTLGGGDNNDLLFGGQDRDLLIGGAGDDSLAGDLGSDTLVGGAGADLFLIASGALFTAASADADIILDFEQGIDRITLQGNQSFSDLTLVTTPAEVTISLGTTVLATVQGAGAIALTAADFTNP